jgi:hypothetical protein
MLLGVGLLLVGLIGSSLPSAAISLPSLASPLQGSGFAVAEVSEKGSGGLGAGARIAESEVGTDPGALQRLWQGLLRTPLGQRIEGILGWITSFFRFLWTIPKALFQGDSAAMIEALGDLLSRASSDGSEAVISEETEMAPSSDEGALPPSDFAPADASSSHSYGGN